MEIIVIIIVTVVFAYMFGRIDGEIKALDELKAKMKKDFPDLKF